MNTTTQRVEEHLTKNELRRIRAHQRSIHRISLAAVDRLARRQIVDAVTAAGAVYAGALPPVTSSLREQRLRSAPMRFRELARTDTFVHAWLNAYAHGAYTSWRHSLEELVFMMAMDREQLREQLLRCYRLSSPAPLVIENGAYRG
jgi:hypothetical protein